MLQWCHLPWMPSFVTIVAVLRFGLRDNCTVWLVVAPFAAESRVNKDIKALGISRDNLGDLEKQEQLRRPNRFATPALLPSTSQDHSRHPSDAKEADPSTPRCLKTSVLVFTQLSPIAEIEIYLGFHLKSNWRQGMPVQPWTCLKTHIRCAQVRPSVDHRKSPPGNTPRRHILGGTANTKSTRMLLKTIKVVSKMAKDAPKKLHSYQARTPQLAISVAPEPGFWKVWHPFGAMSG